MYTRREQTKKEVKKTTALLQSRNAMLLSIFLPLLVASLVQAAPTDTDPIPYKGPGVYYTKGNGTVEDLLQELPDRTVDIGLLYTNSTAIEDFLQELLERNSPETVDNDQEEKTGERRGRSLPPGCYDSPVYGSSTQGSSFVDILSSNPGPCGVDITHVILRHGCLIDSIQVFYKTETGNAIIGPKHGGDGGIQSFIAFDDDERIITVAGTVNTDYVQQITFVTEKSSGEIQIYGPFGGSCSYYCGTGMFIVHGNPRSFYGRSGMYMNAIGFYYTD